MFPTDKNLLIYNIRYVIKEDINDFSVRHDLTGIKKICQYGYLLE